MFGNGDFSDSEQITQFAGFGNFADFGESGKLAEFPKPDQAAANHVTDAMDDFAEIGKLSESGKILSVTDRTIREWLSRIDKDTKDARDKKIFEMWLACYTQQEIANAVECSQAEVAKNIPNGDSSIWNKSDEAAANHVTDFEIPIYNIWKQRGKTPGNNHFGSTEIRWLDNLLYLYTKPFDIVVD